MAGKISINYEITSHDNTDKALFSNQIDANKSFRLIEKRHCECGAPDSKKLIAIFFNKDFAEKVGILLSNNIN